MLKDKSLRQDMKEKYGQKVVSMFIPQPHSLNSVESSNNSSFARIKKNKISYKQSQQRM